jgi:hypothetical protein
MWSLAVLRIDVEPAWLQLVLKRIETQIRDFNSGTMFSSVLWSLAVMKHAPSGSWMEHFLIQVTGVHMQGPEFTQDGTQKEKGKKTKVGSYCNTAYVHKTYPVRVIHWVVLSLSFKSILASMCRSRGC